MILKCLVAFNMVFILVLSIFFKMCWGHVDHGGPYMSGWHSTLLITHFKKQKQKQPSLMFLQWAGNINIQKCLKSITTEHFWKFIF